MNDVQTPDNTEPGVSKRREADITSRSEQVLRMMKLFEDKEFLDAMQKLQNLTDANEAVSVIKAANERLLANLDPETARLFTASLAESVAKRNVQQPLDKLQSAAQAKLGSEAPASWGDADQKMFVEALAKNNIPIKPLTPAPAPKI